MVTVDVPAEIEGAIFVLRGQRVMLDADLADLADLAALDGVETRVLTQAMRRNREGFPADFMFQLSTEAFADLRSRFVLSSRWGGRRYRPFAFTEQGVAMLSSVLRSRRAVLVNVEIMRAFVRLRRLLSAHADLERRLDDLEARYDGQFRAVFDAIRELMQPPDAPRRRLGFVPRDS